MVVKKNVSLAALWCFCYGCDLFSGKSAWPRNFRDELKGVDGSVSFHSLCVPKTRTVRATDTRNHKDKLSTGQ